MLSQGVAHTVARKATKAKNGPMQADLNHKPMTTLKAEEATATTTTTIKAPVSVSVQYSEETEYMVKHECWR